MAEIANPDFGLANLSAEAFQLLMRTLQELVEQAELMHQFKRGGMYGISAKVAEEIRMLL